jgi:hypothetical protein
LAAASRARSARAGVATRRPWRRGSARRARGGTRGATLADLPLSRESAASDAPYEIFADGSLVRVEDDHEGGITIVLAGPEFGKAYAGYVLGQGLGGLFRVR